jgi:hypothetical protein
MAAQIGVDPVGKIVGEEPLDPDATVGGETPGERRAIERRVEPVMA